MFLPTSLQKSRTVIINVFYIVLLYCIYAYGSFREKTAGVYCYLMVLLCAPAYLVMSKTFMDLIVIMTGFDIAHNVFITFK